MPKIKKEYAAKRIHFPVHPAAGFREDMELLFTKYTEYYDADTKANKKHSMEYFSKAWNDVQFHLVFRGGKDVRELREIIEELYLEVIKDLNPSLEPRRRIFAIFLLLSLYTKQPETELGQICIPMESDAWLNAKNTLYLCGAEQEVAACLALSELLRVGAINFVAFSRPRGPAVINNLQLLGVLENGALTDEDHPGNKQAQVVYAEVCESIASSDGSIKNNIGPQDDSTNKRDSGTDQTFNEERIEDVDPSPPQAMEVDNKDSIEVAENEEGQLVIGEIFELTKDDEDSGLDQLGESSRNERGF